MKNRKIILLICLLPFLGVSQEFTPLTSFESIDEERGNFHKFQDKLLFFYINLDGHFIVDEYNGNVPGRRIYERSINNCAYGERSPHYWNGNIIYFDKTRIVIDSIYTGQSLEFDMTNLEVTGTQFIYHPIVTLDGDYLKINMSFDKDNFYYYSLLKKKIVPFKEKKIGYKSDKFDYYFGDLSPIKQYLVRQLRSDKTKIDTVLLTDYISARVINNKLFCRISATSSEHFVIDSLDFISTFDPMPGTKLFLLGFDEEHILAYSSWSYYSVNIDTWELQGSCINCGANYINFSNNKVFFVNSDNEIGYHDFNVDSTFYYEGSAFYLETILLDSLLIIQFESNSSEFRKFRIINMLNGESKIIELPFSSHSIFSNSLFYKLGNKYYVLNTYPKELKILEYDFMTNSLEDTGWYKHNISGIYGYIRNYKKSIYRNLNNKFLVYDAEDIDNDGDHIFEYDLSNKSNKVYEIEGNAYYLEKDSVVSTEDSSYYKIMKFNIKTFQKEILVELVSDRTNLKLLRKGPFLFFNKFSKTSLNGFYNTRSNTIVQTDIDNGVSIMNNTQIFTENYIYAILDSMLLQVDINDFDEIQEVVELDDVTLDFIKDDAISFHYDGYVYYYDGANLTRNIWETDPFQSSKFNKSENKNVFAYRSNNSILLYNIQLKKFLYVNDDVLGLDSFDYSVAYWDGDKVFIKAFKDHENYICTYHTVSNELIKRKLDWYWRILSLYAGEIHLQKYKTDSIMILDSKLEKLTIYEHYGLKDFFKIKTFFPLESNIQIFAGSLYHYPYTNVFYYEPESRSLTEIVSCQDNIDIINMFRIDSTIYSIMSSSELGYQLFGLEVDYHLYNSIINDNNKLDVINFYPNPVIGTVFFEKEYTHVKLYNLNGILIKEHRTNTDRLNISDLKSGLYILRIYDGASWRTMKVVKI